MNLFGSKLAFPLRVDTRGAFAVVTDQVESARQSLVVLISTRQGERVMMPDLGMPDLVFSIVDASFAARLRYHLREQIAKYAPTIEPDVRVVVIAGDGSDPHTVMVSIDFRLRGSSDEHNLTYPYWRLKQ